MDSQSAERPYPQSGFITSVTSDVGPAPGRSCGTCRMCCKVMGVFELEKPPGPWCSHLSLDQGCTIYEQRPPTCRSFICGWLAGAMDLQDRPDKTRVVIHCTPAKARWRDPSGHEVIDHVPVFQESVDGAARKGRMGRWILWLGMKTFAPLIIVRPNQERLAFLAPGRSTAFPGIDRVFHNDGPLPQWVEVGKDDWQMGLAQWRAAQNV